MLDAWAAPPVIEPTTIWQVRMRIRATVFGWSLGCDMCTWTPQYTPFPRKVLKDICLFCFFAECFWGVFFIICADLWVVVQVL